MVPEQVIAREQTPVANMAHKEDEEGESIFDSGCTEYITYLSNILVNKKATHFEARVVIPNGNSVPVKGKGDYILPGGTKSSLIPLSRGSFDVIVGMDWLSKRKFVIVCYEKVVRIPLEGYEILHVHGERTLGAAKSLMNVKIDEPRISVITVVRDFTDVFPEGLLGLPPQRQVEFRIDLVHGVTPVVKSSYRLALLEMQQLSEQLQELEDKGFI
ncbi:hypothetical protein Tco_1180615 [Tanacetum coccineum]